MCGVGRTWEVQRSQIYYGSLWVTSAYGKWGWHNDINQFELRVGIFIFGEMFIKCKGLHSVVDCVMVISFIWTYWRLSNFIYPSSSWSALALRQHWDCCKLYDGKRNCPANKKWIMLYFQCTAPVCTVFIHCQNNHVSNTMTCTL